MYTNNNVKIMLKRHVSVTHDFDHELYFSLFFIFKQYHIKLEAVLFAQNTQKKKQ